ncbi:hypothetical protein AN644_02030 [Candidatus Epulonipiscium fishelsonii]|nr:hypothetical protein AN644_02030 [Epulopiscium sp. SCG-C06WGA-EpuloA1]
MEIHGVPDNTTLKEYLTLHLQKEGSEAIKTVFFGETNGKSIISSGNFSSSPGFFVNDREWYKLAVQKIGMPAYSTPEYSDGEQEMAFIISRTIKDPFGEIAGVLACEVSIADLNDILVNLLKDDGSYVFIVNDDRQIISHSDERYSPTPQGMMTLEGDYENLFKYAPLSVTNAETISGLKVYSTLYDVEGTGWNVISDSPKEIVTNVLAIEVIKVIIIFVIAIVAVILIIRKFNVKYIAPISELASELKKIKDGNLNINVSNIHIESIELNELVGSAQTISNVLKNYIGDISNILETFASGDFRVRFDQDYIGEFASIKLSMQNISIALTSLLKETTSSASEVSEGANQIAQSAESLATYSMEQVRLLSEFKNTTNEMIENILENIENVGNTYESIQDMNTIAKTGKETMQEMTTAIKTISNKTKKISEVIMNIDDISQQTNILALNAAIESARAGDAGKGFAVVSTQVRELANRTGEIVQDINNMLKEMLESVKVGEEMVNITSQNLDEIVTSIGKTTEASQVIKTNSSIQKTYVDKIVVGTKELIYKVEGSSAISEENVAISEELAGQSTILKDQLYKFKV